MKRLTVLVLLFTLIGVQLSAHSGKPKYNVIIDTDGAIDDMRAISMLLSSNDIRVLAITCSQGTLIPGTVFKKINSLLSAFHHEGIPVGISHETDFKLPEWSGFVESISWGKPVNTQYQNFNRNSIDVLNSVVENYPEKLTLIALGSLKTYADWLESDPDISRKIKQIIWYNNHDIKAGFNYQVSPDSYKFIINSDVQLEMVANISDDMIVDRAYLNEIQNANSLYAEQINFVLSQDAVAEKIDRGIMYLWDDIVPLYLEVPLLFDIETKDGIKYASIMKQISPELIYELIGRLLVSATAANNRVFSSFPVDTTLYLSEYAKMVNPTIEKYGLIEWKAITLTNEIHGHTGIYSIIGAKMGIRAIEYFNVGVNNMQVVTFAGEEPPLSCFNDGIQISTGSTIGQGLIKISDSVSIVPTAIFEFNNQKVKISLKPEIAEQISNEIKFGVENYGLLTDRYWLYIEYLAINYWKDCDRMEIFMIENSSSTVL